jgi:ribosome-binding protein aMBF1 (putative translation factor)
MATDKTKYQSFQDHAPQVLRNKAATAAAAATAAGSRASGEAKHLAKLDRSELPPPRRLASECLQAIRQARADKKLTQAQLNTALSFPPNTIRDIEANRANPSPGQMTSLQRYLGIRLHYEHTAK